jgi:hypothetical protein
MKIGVVAFLPIWRRPPRKEGKGWALLGDTFP